MFSKLLHFLQCQRNKLGGRGQNVGGNEFYKPLASVQILKLIVFAIVNCMYEYVGSNSNNTVNNGDKSFRVRCNNFSEHP